jgi:exocyst complex component 8
VNEVIIELKSNFSAHKSLVRDLSCGITSELNAWENFYKEIVDLENSEQQNLIDLDNDNPRVAFLLNLDMLIAEHKTEEALSMLLDSVEVSESNTSEISKRKDMLIDQLVAISNQPCIKFSELKKSLQGLIKLDKESLAQELFLKVFASRLQGNIDLFLPSCSVHPNTYTATLSHLVFSTIFEAAKEFNILFGEKELPTSLLVEWAESEIEHFIHLVKENAPLLENTAALCSACICIQASLSYCAILESKGLKLSCIVLDLLSHYIEEVIDKNFRRARRMVLDLSSQSDTLDQSSSTGLHFPADALTNFFLTNNVKKFMSILKVSLLCNLDFTSLWILNVNDHLSKND